MQEQTHDPQSPEPVIHPRRGRKPRLRPPASALVGKKYLRLLQDHLGVLRSNYPHPNRLLFLDDVLVVYLLAFFNPTLRSLRCIEDASELPAIQQHLSVHSVCKSTLSDANALFDPALLVPLIVRLKQACGTDFKPDPDLQTLYHKVIVFDGSFFDLAGDVAWAIQTSNGQFTTSQVRLNLHYCTASGLPEGISVSGATDGAETDAAINFDAQPGQILIADRGVFSFRLLCAMQAQGCHCLLRVKNNIGFDRTQQRELVPKDHQFRVLADHLGGFTSTAGHSPAPGGVWREVIIKHQSDPEQTVRIITDLLDLEAWQIGELYRQRWQIELFFRWLKVHAHFRHLTSHSPRGITMSFYTALIAMLLTALHSQSAMSKYGYNLLGMVASGQASLEDILPVLHKRQRACDLEKQRLARKKAALKKA
jgi:Transposase DDE domain